MNHKQFLCALVCFVSAVGAAVASADSKPRTVPQYDARTFFETTSVFGSSFSADETKMLLTMDASGVFNVYSQPLAGGRPKMLTKSTTNATVEYVVFPDEGHGFRKRVNRITASEAYLKFLDKHLKAKDRR